MNCPFCNRHVKLNEIIRSAHHIIGCIYCPDSEAELRRYEPEPETVKSRLARRRRARAARPFTLQRVAAVDAALAALAVAEAAVDAVPVHLQTDVDHYERTS